MTYAIVFGTRPEAIKIAPVARELARRGCDTVLISTGQHREMLDQTCEQLGIAADVDLRAMRAGQSLAQLTARLVTKLDELFGDIRPEVVFVQGDTTTALAGALAAYYRQVRVGHIEAGLRTDDIYSPFPEEGNRRLISPLARHHFAPTRRAADALLAEGTDPSTVHVTGNTVIDSLLWALDRGGVVPALTRSRRALVTLHRRENHGETLVGLTRAIRTLSESHDVEFLFPVHRNPAVREVVFRELGGVDGVSLIDPLGYLDLIAALDSSDIVLTDSGGLQEEAPALGKPVLVLRDTTERPEAIEHGTAMLVGVDPSRVIDVTSMLLDDELLYRSMATRANPFGDGLAAERIVATALGEQVQPFGVHELDDLRVAV